MKWYRLININAIDKPYPLANPNKSSSELLVHSNTKIVTAKNGLFFLNQDYY